MRRFVTYFAQILLMVCCIGYAAAAEDFEARVNIVLDDGTVMLYAGAKKGVAAGDVFEIRRDSAVVGHIRVVDVKEHASYCEVTDGNAREYDLAVRTAQNVTVKKKETAPVAKPKAPPAEAHPAEEVPAEDIPPAEPAPVKEKTPKTVKKASAPPAEEAPADEAQAEPAPVKPPAGKPAKSKGDAAPRPDKAKEPLPAKPATTAPSQKDAKNDKADDKNAKAAITEHQIKKDAHAPLGDSTPANYGLSGVIYNPNADVLPKNKGVAHLFYVKADDDDKLFTDFGVGVTYGLSANIELAYTRISTELDVPDTVSSNISADSSSSVMSLKYQFANTKPFSLVSANISEMRYAAVLQYYDQKISVTGLSEDETNGGTTRVAGVATGKYTLGSGTAALYYQTGDMVDDTDFSGVGLYAGIDCPLAMALPSARVKDVMSLVAEYDSKAYYIGSMNALSFGFRYAYRSIGTMTLSVSDITGSKIIGLKGTYNF